MSHPAPGHQREHAIAQARRLARSDQKQKTALGVHRRNPVVADTDRRERMWAMAAVTAFGAYRLLGSLTTARQLTSKLLGESCRISKRSQDNLSASISLSLAGGEAGSSAFIPLLGGAITALTADARTPRGANTNDDRTPACIDCDKWNRQILYGLVGS
jgi:hypothetical protein